MDTRRSLQRTSSLLLATILAFGLLGVIDAEVARAATPVITFRAWIDNTCVGGTAPASAKVRVVWKDSKGRIKKKGTVRAGKKGKWSLCRSGKRVQPGDRIVARVGSKGRSKKVPRLTMSIDRVNQTVTGKAPPGAPVVVEYRYWRERFSGDGYDDRSGRVDSQGRFEVDMDCASCAAAMLGGERVAVFIPTSRKRPDLWGREQQVPYVDVKRGASALGGAFRPGAVLSVRLLKGVGEPQKAEWTGGATGTTSAKSNIYGGRIQLGGRYSGTFKNGGAAVSAIVGDQVASTAMPPVPGMPVPPIAVTADKGTDVVAGTCASRTRYDLVAKSPDRSKRRSHTAVTNAGGEFWWNLKGKLDLKKGSKVTLSCHHWTGDRVSTSVLID